MTHETHLRIALWATIAAITLLVAASVLATTASAPAGQEQFEILAPAADYTARLTAAEGGLRAVLFADSLFIPAYTVAIVFTALAFRAGRTLAAWLSIVGIIAVLLLDFRENAVMAGSLDLAVTTGAVAMERISHQALVSSMKWQTTAATMVAVSFVLPNETFEEKLLVWGVRLGMPVAAPLFLLNPFGLRVAGGLMLLACMGGGFILLADVVRRRLQGSHR